MTASESTAISTSQLTLLGTGTSVGVPMVGCDCAVCTSTNPRNHRTRTGVWVQNGERSFLIDTGPELRLQLVRSRVRKIEGVVYTHAHADHIIGLDDLRIFGFRQPEPIPLYCEAGVEATIRRTFSYAFSTEDSLHSRPRLEFRRIMEEKFFLAGLEIQPIRFEHGMLGIFGYRIGDVAFCTDVSNIPEASWALLKNLRVLILGAIRDEPHPTHFNVAQAIEVAQRCGAEQTYLTHVSHSLDFEETNARLPEGIQLSYDGQIISINIG